MKPVQNFLSARSITFWAIGVALGLVCGWSLGHRAGNPQAGTIGTPPANTRDAADARDAAGMPLGPRGKGAPVSRKESRDFAQSVRAIFRENVKLRRIAQFEKLVERTGIEHLPDLVSLIRENDLRGNDSGEEWTRIWTSWGERDPQAAMDFFKSYDWTGWNDAARGEAKNRTLANWAQANPETARQFVEADKDFMNGDRSMVYGLVEGWANVDPEAAAAWLFKTGLGMSAEYEKVVAALSRKGGQEGLEAWFAQLDPAKIPAKDMAGFAQVIANKKGYEPDKAAAWIEGHLGAAWVEESDIVGPTARAFAERDPRAAVEWAAKTGLEQATHIAVATWCQQDLGAASSWVKENAERPESIRSATVVMAYLNRKDPAAAREWAEGLSNKSLRDRLLGL